MMANQEDKPLDGDTTAVKEAHSLSAFHSVAIYDASTIEISLGDSYQVEIDGAKVYADAQQIEMHGDELSIKFSDHDSNHRKTAIKITVPSLRALKIVGCGKLTVLGKVWKSDNIDLDLQRVSVAILSPSLEAKNISVSLQGVMFMQCHVDCHNFQWKSRSIGHAKIWGHANKQSFDVEHETQIDKKGLKLACRD